MTAVVPFRQRDEGEEPLDVEVVEVHEPVSLVKDLDDLEEYDDEDERPPSKARELAVALARPLPSPYRVLATTRWWTRVATQVLPWLPIYAVCELRPIFRGLFRVVVRWSAWVHCAGLAEAVKEAEKNEHSKAAERLVKRRSARAWGSLVTLVLLSGGMTWLYFRVPLGFWGAVGVLAVIFSAVGRAGMGGVDNPIPFATPTVLSRGVPLSQVTASILATFDREGFEEGSVQVASPLTWDETRSEYRIKVKTADGIKPEHLRALERAVGAKDHAIRNLATGVASVRELVIRVGDPLAAPVERPWIETGTRSVTQPVELGVSMTDIPYAVPFAGVHMRLVAGTGGGKTKWNLRAMIDGLSACHDVVIGGVDISNGPELTLWRGVIQYRGLNIADAEKVLDFALAEIDRRSKILTAIAEDDDPDNDTDEWHSGLGPAFVVFADEFSQLAAFDGKKEAPDGSKPNLLGKCETIVRTGRKHWVSLVMQTQKTGNNDFGSSTMSSLCAVTIAGPCDPGDAVRMFGVERRDAGYTPHLLAPGVEGDGRDAGKVFIDSPMHRTPDIYRAFAPGSTAEVKRRAMQRVADGLPTLDERRHESVDAVEVPPVLAAVERAFADAGNPERMPTAELIDRLRPLGFDLDENKLAAGVRPAGLRPARNRWTPPEGGNPVRGYLLVDVQLAIRRLS